MSKSEKFKIRSAAIILLTSFLIFHLTIIYW
jgi:hypothetical protein